MSTEWDLRQTTLRTGAFSSVIYDGDVVKHGSHGSGSGSQAGTRLSLRHDVSDIVCHCNKGTNVPLNKPRGMVLFVASSIEIILTLLK